MGLREFEKFLGFKTKIKWFLSITFISYHFLGFWWIWHYAFPVRFMSVLFFAVMFVVNGMGITCGVHRLFTHRSYSVKTPLKIFLLLCYAATGQYPIYLWIRDHRVHHKFSDTDADPHNSNRGLFFSHMGWLLLAKTDEVRKQEKKIDMSDIENDRHIMFLSKHYIIFAVVFCFLLPTLTGILLWGENWKCAVAWQCFLRYLSVLHSEFSVNSFAHAYGYTPYNSNHLSKQNKFVSIASFGEGWHNYHHMFPYDYKASEFFDFISYSTYVIKYWEAMGWAYNLKEASPEIINLVAKRLGDGIARTHN